MRPQRPAVAVMTANQVVSYRLHEARTSRGWTQQEAADRLAPYLGVRWSAASFSGAEGGWRVGRRVREFCADELFALVRTFEVPLLWFFVPPPGSRLAGFPDDVAGLGAQEMADVVVGSAEGAAQLERRLQHWWVDRRWWARLAGDVAGEQEEAGTAVSGRGVALDRAAALLRELAAVLDA